MIYQNKKIFILGKEDLGWSIDKDRFYTQKAILDLGIKITDKLVFADIIFSVWWSKLSNWRFYIIKKLIKKRKIIATISTDLSHQEKEFNKLKSIVDIWIYANMDQKKFLKKNNISKKNMFYNPFYVDEKIFKNLNLSKKEICKELDIDYGLIKEKFLIGSFQRDSLGSDLTQPKWQKNPDLLIEILKELDKKIFLLIIAGPRRHYIINKCKKFNLPFIFIGNKKPIEEGIDDIKKNILDLEKINLLYNFIDLYIVTSKSEGGPKSIIEAPLTKTTILSTKIGMAGDLLVKDSLCESKEEFIDKIERLRKNISFRKRIINENYQKVSKVNNWDAFKKRVDKIICRAKK